MLNYPNANAGQLAKQSVLQGTAQSIPQSPAPPDTLLSAMSSTEALTKRLAELYGQVHEIAIAIGGPFPCGSKEDVAPSPGNPHAMYLLNQRLGFAHSTVTEITEAITAIRRALGA